MKHNLVELRSVCEAGQKVHVACESRSFQPETSSGDGMTYTMWHDMKSRDVAIILCFSTVIVRYNMI